MSTRKLKVTLTDENGVVIDRLTMKVDSEWRYFSINPVESEADPRASEFVLIAASAKGGGAGKAS